MERRPDPKNVRQAIAVSLAIAASLVLLVLPMYTEVKLMSGGPGQVSHSTLLETVGPSIFVPVAHPHSPDRFTSPAPRTCTDTSVCRDHCCSCGLRGRRLRKHRLVLRTSPGRRRSRPCCLGGSRGTLLARHFLTGLNRITLPPSARTFGTAAEAGPQTAKSRVILDQMWCPFGGLWSGNFFD